jgi:hypothetical protein
MAHFVPRSALYFLNIIILCMTQLGFESAFAMSKAPKSPAENLEVLLDAAERGVAPRPAVPVLAALKRALRQTSEQDLNLHFGEAVRLVEPGVLRVYEQSLKPVFHASDRMTSGAVEEGAGIQIDGAAFAHLKEFSRGLVELLRQEFKLSLEQGEHLGAQFLIPHSWFQSIQGYFETDSSFFHLGLLVVLHNLIHRMESLEEVSDPHARFYFVYALSLKSALMIAVAEAENESRYLSQRGIDCRTDEVFVGDFSMVSVLKLFHGHVLDYRPFLEKKETRLALHHMRAAFLSGEPSQVSPQTTLLYNEAKSALGQFSVKHSIPLRLGKRKACFPELSRIIPFHEE